MATSLGTSTLPPQAVPLSKKDDKWKESSVEGIIGMSTFNSGASVRMTDVDTNLHWRSIAHKNYEFYNGIIDDEDYTHVLAPYGKTRDNMPAKLHNYPIIKPNVDVLLGEFSKRPRNYSVTVVNPDVVTLKSKAKKEVTLKNLQQIFMASLEEIGVLPPDGGEQPKPPAEVEAEFDRTYRDGRAVNGQKALNYIEFSQKLSRAWEKHWFHFLVSGYMFSKKTAVDGEVVYEVLNPVYTDYDKSPEIEFIEDGDWASTCRYQHLSKVLDSFYDVLTEKEVKALENPSNENHLIANSDIQNDSGTGRVIEVIDVCWKSLAKVGIVTYDSEVTGMEESYYVTEKTKIESGHKVEWYWVNEVWEGTRIDGKIYKNIRPVAVQRTDMDNPSKCKLPINGRTYSSVNAPNISMVTLGIPLQLTYNIYKYRLENEIAKAKGMIAMLDIDMIPEEFGNGEDAIDKFFYYIDSLGIAFQQRNKEGDQQAASYQQVLDLTIKTIEAYLRLLDSIIAEWEMISGVSRQRKGAMTQYDGKATSEQSIIQSSHITEDYFQKMEAFIETELQGIIDLSKPAFIGGKKAQYSLPDGRDAYLDLDGLSHMETNYGIFIAGSAKENKKIEGLRQFGSEMAASGNVPISMLAEIMEADNFIDLKEKIKKIEKLTEEKEKAAQEAEQQMQQAQMKQNQELAQMDQQEKALDRETKIKVAMIQQETAMNKAQIDAMLKQPAPDAGSLDLQKHRDTVDLENRKLDLDRTTSMTGLDLQKQKQDDDLAVKQEELRIKDKVASKPTPRPSGK